ncbi:MAG: MAPEG family protein [Halioglobus sp.]
MELVAVITLLIVLEYLVFTMLVGVARGKSGIQAPATTGDPVLERTLRVQMNTLEQLAIVIPSLWLFGLYVSPEYAAGLGLVFAIARVLYYRGYVAEPAKRGLGFGIGFLATLVLLVGAIYGSGMAAIAQL